MKKERAKKSFDKFFEPYTWAKDETAAEGAEQRKELSGQVVKLYKAKSQLKPSDPRRAEADLGDHFGAHWSIWGRGCTEISLST